MKKKYNEKFNIDWKNRLFHLSYSNGELLIWGRFSKFKNWEIQINNSYCNKKELSVEATSFKRLWGDFVFIFQFSLLFIWGTFVITDVRIWDFFTDKPVSWQEMENLDKIKRIGKPKYKYRKIKEKWFYNSKFLKLYNRNFLNDPYGITVDIAFFPLLVYTLLQVGFHQRHNFCIAINFNLSETKPLIEFELCLFSLFLKFEFGRNTVIRKANLKHISDFENLIKHSAKPYLLTDSDEDIVQLQIERKNLAYLNTVLKHIDITKLDTNEILIDGMYKEFYNAEIFDLLLNNILQFTNWEEVENSKDSYNPEAIAKLKAKYLQDQSEADSKGSPVKE